ncbi:MAG: hypothetical protein ACI8XC_003153 [Gammaproteobacteria bacterium]|jgi:hypothetical protein
MKPRNNYQLAIIGAGTSGIAEPLIIAVIKII